MKLFIPIIIIILLIISVVALAEEISLNDKELSDALIIKESKDAKVKAFVDKELTKAKSSARIKKADVDATCKISKDRMTNASVVPVCVGPNYKIVGLETSKGEYAFIIFTQELYKKIIK